MGNEIRSALERFRENQAQVMALLAEFHHEELLRAAGDPDEPKPRVHNTLPDLRDRLSRMHCADVALVLEPLPSDDRLLLWRQLSHQRGGELLLALSAAVRSDLLARLDEEEVRLAIGQLYSDELPALAAALPAALLQERLVTLVHDDRLWLQESLRYAEGTVGHAMSQAMVVVHEEQTLAEVLDQLRNMSNLPRHTDQLFVINSEGLLRGVMTLQNLLLTPAEMRLGEVMTTNLIAFKPEESSREAVQAFERYHLISAPVVNGEGRLLGRLTIDAVLERLRGEGG